MRTFETGATRNDDTGKPDYEGFYSPLVVESYGRYMSRHRRQADGQVRASDNWQKGIPLNAYMKSMFRHFIDVWKLHRAGEPVDSEGHPITMEESLNALIFNAQGYLHEILKADAVFTNARRGSKIIQFTDAPPLGDGAFTYLGSDPEREHAAATQQRWQDAAEAQPLDGYYVQHAPEYRTEPLRYHLKGEDVYLVSASGETLMPPGYSRRVVTPWIRSGQWEYVGGSSIWGRALLPQYELDLDACGTIDGVNPIPLPYLARYAGGWNDSNIFGDHWLINDAGEVFYGSVGSWDKSVMQLGEVQERIETGQWKRCDTEGKLLKLLPEPGLKYDGHWNDLDGDPNHYIIAGGAVTWEDGTVWRRYSDDRYAEAADLIEVGSWFRCDVNGKRL